MINLLPLFTFPIYSLLLINLTFIYFNLPNIYVFYKKINFVKYPIKSWKIYKTSMKISLKYHKY